MVRRAVRPRDLGVEQRPRFGPPRKSWADYKAEAKVQTGGSSEQANYWIRPGSSCPQLSAFFGTISRAFELERLDAGLEGGGGVQVRHLGRGFPVRFVWGTVVPPNSPGHHQQAGSWSFWSGMLFRLRERVRSCDLGLCQWLRRKAEMIDKHWVQDNKDARRRATRTSARAAMAIVMSMVRCSPLCWALRSLGMPSCESVWLALLPRLPARTSQR